MLMNSMEFWRREVRGEGVYDELPKGLFPEVAVISLVVGIVAVPVIIIWF